MDEKAYWSREVAVMLGIQPVTLRAWSKLFEERGYEFLKDDNNRRAYRDSDIGMFRHYQELMKSKEISQDSAIDIVMERHSGGFALPIARSAMNIEEVAKRYDERFTELSDLVNTVIEQNKQLQRELHKRDQEQDERQAERDKLLTDFITEFREAREQAASTQEKPRKFWTLWRK